MTPGLAKLPVANPAADVPAGDPCWESQAGAGCGHQDLTGAGTRSQPLCAMLAGWRVMVGFYSLGKCLLLISFSRWSASGSEVRQELHPVPAVGVQRVTVIKRGEKAATTACSPLEGHAPSAFLPGVAKGCFSHMEQGWRGCRAHTAPNSQADTISFHWWYRAETRLFPTDPHFPKSPALPTGHRSSSDSLVLFINVPSVLLSQHSMGEL